MLYNLVMLLPCAVCLIYALQLTCRRKENSKSQNILALCLLLTSVSLLIFTNSLAGVTDYSTYSMLRYHSKLKDFYSNLNDKSMEVDNKLIGEDRIFLQSTLRADELAAKMRTNRTYLSRMIKEEFQCFFSDYINQKRIEHAQKLMQKNPDMKLAELADKSGFININSFGRTFKQVVGLPPKEWLIKNLKHL